MQSELFPMKLYTEGLNRDKIFVQCEWCLASASLSSEISNDRH